MRNYMRVVSCMLNQPRFAAPQADMTGQTVLLTGPTRGGIGYATAAELRKRGANLVLLGRNESRVADAASALRGGDARPAAAAATATSSSSSSSRTVKAGDSGASEGVMPGGGDGDGDGAHDGSIVTQTVDLASLSSVRGAIAALATVRVDVLICNAGAQHASAAPAPRFQGVEPTFAACALGHHALIAGIRPRRVVWLTGDVYVLAGGARGRVTPYETRGGPLARYARACVARIWLAAELKRRDPATQVIVVHPGVVASNFSGLRGVAHWLVDRCFIDVVQGAQACVYAACADASGLRQECGTVAYYHNKFGWVDFAPDDAAVDREQARRLFDECDRICGIEARR